MSLSVQGYQNVTICKVQVSKEYQEAKKGRAPSACTPARLQLYLHPLLRLSIRNHPLHCLPPSTKGSFHGRPGKVACISARQFACCCMNADQLQTAACATIKRVLHHTVQAMLTARHLLLALGADQCRRKANEAAHRASLARRPGKPSWASPPIALPATMNRTS